MSGALPAGPYCPSSETVKRVCKKPATAPFRVYPQRVGRKIEGLQQQITRAQFVNSIMWTRMNKPANAKGLHCKELRQRILRVFRQTRSYSSEF